ncbi:MAG: hypothetical protein IJ250_03545 [Bacteroidales bacterium]|nr:hypothetical protein [Bacteroidales bacterium]
MKKIVATVALFACSLVLGMNCIAQQGEWAGIIKYKLTWKGNVPEGNLPETYETKVFKNLEGTDFMTYVSLGGLMKSISNSNNHMLTVMVDFSMFPDEGPYEGMSGKWYFKEKADMEKAKSKIHYEYTGNTKEIAGLKCEEVKVSAKSEESGKEESEVIWVTKELGPKENMTYYPGLDAFPMEFTIDLSAELSILVTVTECLKGKASQADLMLESGYEEIAKEDFQEWMQRLGRSMQ